MEERFRNIILSRNIYYEIEIYVFQTAET